MVLQPPQEIRGRTETALRNASIGESSVLLAYGLCNGRFFLMGYSNTLRGYPPPLLKHTPTFTTWLCNGSWRAVNASAKKQKKNKNPTTTIQILSAAKPRSTQTPHCWAAASITPGNKYGFQPTFARVQTNRFELEVAVGFSAGLFLHLFIYFPVCAAVCLGCFSLISLLFIYLFIYFARGERQT